MLLIRRVRGDVQARSMVRHLLPGQTTLSSASKGKYRDVDTYHVAKQIVGRD